MNTAKKLLKSNRIRPLKRLGQNFLIDKASIKKLVKSADLGLKDIVLEIGPGTGTLSYELAKKVKKLVVVEKDPRMVKILREKLKVFKNIEVINQDIMKLDISGLSFQASGFKVVANLPFYLTAPLIRKLIEEKNKLKEMTLIIQKEVAQRIAAHPPKMNLLAISIQFYAKPDIIDYIPKKSFWPQPKVDSAIIKIIPHRIKDPTRVNRYLFFRIVKAGFSHTRKQLINNLSKELALNRQAVKNWLLKNKIQPSQRAETLKIKDWINLAKSFRIKI